VEVTLSKHRLFSTLTLALLICGAVFIAYAADKQKPGALRLLQDLPYTPQGRNHNQILDLLLPTSASKEHKVPLIVWIHGGAWCRGDKKETPSQFFARAGYAIASIDYRLTDEARFPAQVEDCKAAIRWLRAHADEYNFDSNRIGIFGGSAGGHLVAMLGLTGDDKEFDDTGSHRDLSSKVQAVCDWCGPADLTTFVKQAGKHYCLDREMQKFLGGKLEDNRELALKASPISYVTPNAPPFLIMHGDADEMVPYAQSEQLVEALKKAHDDVQFITIKGGGHAFGSAETITQVLDFFDAKLKMQR
jgi:acetyl esterase/lipase